MNKDKPLWYLWRTSVLFVKSLFLYLIKKDDAKLEKIYYEMMDLEIDYVERFSSQEEKLDAYRQKIIELTELVAMKEPIDILKIKSLEGKMYKGLKLRQNIINNIYIETWLINNKLWLYILENKEKGDRLIPFDKQNESLVRLDQIYYSLRAKRTYGLLRF